VTPDHVVVDRSELAYDDHTWQLEGHRYADAGVSLILVEMPPGEGVRLHRHAYGEVFVVHEGRATYTVGAATLEVRAGQVVIVSPGVPHGFVSTGDAPLRQTDIHLSERIVTEWLED